MSLMLLICPSAINLLLNCQHVKFSSQMSAWAYYVPFVKNIWIWDEVRVQAKRFTWLRLPSRVTPALTKRNKEVSEENSQFSTSEKQLNKFSRRSLKFTVCFIMLVDIASYNVPKEMLLMAEFIFHGGKMCKFSTLCDRLFSLSVFLLHLLSIFCSSWSRGMSKKSCKEICIACSNFVFKRSFP